MHTGEGVGGMEAAGGCAVVQATGPHSSSSDVRSPSASRPNTSATAAPGAVACPASAAWLLGLGAPLPPLLAAAAREPPLPRLSPKGARDASCPTEISTDEAERTTPRRRVKPTTASHPCTASARLEHTRASSSTRRPADCVASRRSKEMHSASAPA
eukprot:scaffold10253_cov124-Isochrysis_galbana.AAC.27